MERRRFITTRKAVLWLANVSYCLYLYGCCLWSLNGPSISLIEIALNKILRKIWHLPPRSHTAIVYCVAQVDTISNLLNKRFQSFRSRSLSSSSPLIKTIFNESIRPSVDGLYMDGTVHISREMHKQCYITRREMTSRAPKPHRHRSRTFSSHRNSL